MIFVAWETSPNTLQAQQELISIYEIINNYNLLLEPNKLCCKPSQDGVYTVEAMRKVVDQKTTTGGDTLITWLKIRSFESIILHLEGKTCKITFSEYVRKEGNSNIIGNLPFM